MLADCKTRRERIEFSIHEVALARARNHLITNGSMFNKDSILSERLQQGVQHISGVRDRKELVALVIDDVQTVASLINRSRRTLERFRRTWLKRMRNASIFLIMSVTTNHRSVAQCKRNKTKHGQLATTIDCFREKSITNIASSHKNLFRLSVSVIANKNAYITRIKRL